jgi:uncharacterized protein GlcG (DUF336 family)
VPIAMRTALAPFVAGGLLLATASAAQELEDRKALNLPLAKAMVAACMNFAEAHGGQINVWIYDITGNPLYFERMDEASVVGMETARRKGITALKSGTTSAEVYVLFEDAGLAGGLIAIQSDWMGNPGGVPLIVDGHLIGSVGAGGMGMIPDHNCAVTAANVALPEGQQLALMEELQ